MAIPTEDACVIAEQVGPLTSCRCFRWLPVQILSTLTHAASPGNGLALNKNNLGSHAYAGAYFAVCSRQQRSGTLHCICLHIHKHEAAHGEIKVQRYEGTRNLQATGPPLLDLCLCSQRLGPAKQEAI